MKRCLVQFFLQMNQGHPNFEGKCRSDRCQFWTVKWNLEFEYMFESSSWGVPPTYGHVFGGGIFLFSPKNLDTKLGGGFKYFLFSSLFGEMIQFDKYFSDGLKPPTSKCWSHVGPIHRSKFGNGSGRSMTPMGTPGSTPLQAMERPGELIDIRNVWMIFFGEVYSPWN